MSIGVERRRETMTPLMTWVGLREGDRTLVACGSGNSGLHRMMDDEAEVLRLERDFIAAWNRGDAHAAAALYAEDGTRVGAFGDVSHGRKEIEAAYAKLLQRHDEGCDRRRAAQRAPTFG